MIEKPAEQAGLILEPGLVEILVRDADGRTLPLLSHALRQVWSRREGRVMTVDGYRASGEIDGAVAKTAEEVFATLSADGERLLRDILLRLVEASADGAVISRRVERTRIAIDDAHAKIVDRLVDARLLTTDEESVQLSHEALAREWPRLKEWLADDVEGQRIMRHLGSAAAAWDAMGRPDSELYRGGRLTAAQHWRDAVGPALTAVEREFLDASAANETAGLAAAQKQLRKERRMVRRLSWVSVGAAASRDRRGRRRASSRGSRRTSQASVRRSQRHGASPRSRSRSRTSTARCCSPWRPSSSGTIPRHASTSCASSRAHPV